MSIERMEQVRGLLHEALEQVEETKRTPEPAAAPVRQALALIRDMHDELNPEYPKTPAPWAPQ